MRVVSWAVAAFAVIGALSPIWGFEALYQHGLWGEQLPLPPEGGATTMLEDALWVALGEAPRGPVEVLWAGNYFRRQSPGRSAVNAVAREVVYQDRTRRLPGLHHHLKMGAVSVWLSRHRTAAQLKRVLADTSPFGRNTRGASSATRAYFGVPLEWLTIGQIALLAAMPQQPSKDPWCHAEAVMKRRAFVLRRLRDLGLISNAMSEPNSVLPVECAQAAFLNSLASNPLASSSEPASNILKPNCEPDDCQRLAPIFATADSGTRVTIANKFAFLYAGNTV